MNRTILKRAAAMMTVAAVCLLTACTQPAPITSPDVPVDVTPSPSAIAYSSSDGKFTVRYNADYSFNPITGTNPDNMSFSPLIYESLFTLDAALTPQPVLCETYTTDNGIDYTFTLKSGVAMTDGSTLNATDVKYSLTQAMLTGRFTSRLKGIAEITVIDPLTLSITLSAPNYRLPTILDIPIIKNGSIDFNHPTGCGPYYYAGDGSPRLVAFTNYRDYDALPVRTIYLKECTNQDLSVEFSSESIDLFWDDPADSSEINILSDHEVRYYDTTILQFVGFNAQNSVLSNPDMRRALGLMIDRAKIVQSVYTVHADPTPLVLSTNYALYDPAWAPVVTDRLTEISVIFDQLNLDDNDRDGFLEYIDDNYDYIPFTLDFIVNGDNDYKVAAAEQIATAMKAVGINVNVSALSWSAYLQALENGNFDLYYADVALPADYDLSELLAVGGDIDYGHVGSDSYAELIGDFLSASDDDTESAAAEALCAYIYEHAPIVPVLYREYAVHTNRNTVIGLSPTVSNIFYGLLDWSVNLT